MWGNDIRKPEINNGFYVEDRVLHQLILESLAGVKGVIGLAQERENLGKKSVIISRNKDKIKIKVYLTGEYGEDLRQTGVVIRERMISSLEELGGVEVERVDIIFSDIGRI